MLCPSDACPRHSSFVTVSYGWKHLRQRIWYHRALASIDLQCWPVRINCCNTDKQQTMLELPKWYVEYVSCAVGTRDIRYSMHLILTITPPFIVGKYQPNENQENCLSCLFGTEASSDGTACQITASSCPAGNYVTGNQCTPCATGVHWIVLAKYACMRSVAQPLSDPRHDCRNFYLWTWRAAVSRSPSMPCR
jgi:hypothetical protein